MLNNMSTRSALHRACRVLFLALGRFQLGGPLSPVRLYSAGFHGKPQL